MQTYTPKQLQSAVEAGGVHAVTIAAQGARFYIQIKSRTGAGVLTKARSSEPRAFTNPMQVFTELRRLGVRNGSFDTTQWMPEQREAPRRVDRAKAMNAMFEDAEYARMLRERVVQACAEADDPRTQWVDQATVEADMEAQRQRILARLDSTG